MPSCQFYSLPTLLSHDLGHMIIFALFRSCILQMVLIEQFLMERSSVDIHWFATCEACMTKTPIVEMD